MADKQEVSKATLKRVKKVILTKNDMLKERKELKSKLLHAGETVEGLYETVKKRGTQLKEADATIEALNGIIEGRDKEKEELEDLLKRAGYEIVEQNETIDSFHKLVTELNKDLAWKEAGRLTLKEELGKLDIIIHQREAQIDKLNIEIEMLCNEEVPVNAMADHAHLEPAPIIAPMYRIVTNGNRYAPEVSRDSGDTWATMWAVAPNSCTNFLSYRSYRGALKYLRKQYGEKADILPREWRAV